MTRQPTRELAQFAATLTFDQIPPEVIERLKLCLLDTFACGLFGASLHWARIVADFAEELGGPGESSIWGRASKVSAPNAALANGTAVHSFEMDDLHKTSIVHPGSVVISSALALAERMGTATGRSFLEAVTAGYETSIRVGMSVGTSHLQKGFHPTGTNGTFGAGAAAGRMLGLDPDRMTHALGIAGTQAAGLMAAQYSAMVKRMHAGRAAQSGVYGALLAQRGLTGITNILEADYGGYCRVMSDQAHMEIITSGLGDHFETAQVGFKPYAAGGSTHAGHEAVKEIMAENKLKADDIDRIVVRATTATYQHTSWEYHPEGVTSAQMNMQYVAAVTALEGEIFIDQFSEEKIRDPEIIAFSRKVSVIADPELDALGPDYRHTVVVEIYTRDGRSFETRVETAKGSNKRPMSPDEVLEKFRILAGKVLKPQQVDDLQQVIFELEDVEDIQLFSSLLH